MRLRLEYLTGAMFLKWGAPAYLQIENDLTISKENGNIGLGIAPHASDKVHIEGSVRLAGAARILRFETQQGGTALGNITSSKYAPGIHFVRTEGSILGKIEYVDTADHSNFLRFHTGSTPSNDLTIGSDHNVGVGTNNPQVKFQVTGSGGNFPAAFR